MRVGFKDHMGTLHIVELDKKQEKELKEIMERGIADTDVLNIEAILRSGKEIAKFDVDWFFELGD